MFGVLYCHEKHMVLNSRGLYERPEYFRLVIDEPTIDIQVEFLG